MICPMNKDSRIIHLCLDGASPVVESQVIDHLRAMHKYPGAPSAHLIVLGRPPAQPRGTLFDPERRLTISRDIGGTFIARTFSLAPAAILIALIALFRLTFPRCLTRRPVIHARARDAAMVASLFKWLCLGRPRVLFDVRGETFSELEERLNTPSETPSHFSIRLALALEQIIVRFCLKSASRVLYVTNALRRSVEKRFPFAARKHGLTIPCLSDEEKFQPDPALRDAVRSDLGFTPRDKVLLYAGGYQWYQCVDEMLELFRLMREKDEHVRFIFITARERHDDMRARLGKIAPPEAYRVMQSPHDRIIAYQNAADLGLLLRRPSPVNACAAPTKFAESLMCGLPLALTRGIGDYSALAERDNLGVMIADLDDLPAAADSCLAFLDRPELMKDRERIAGIAREHLGRAARIPDYLALYAQM